MDPPAGRAGGASARRYAGEHRLVLEVDDPFLPQNTGRYELAVGAEGAECRPTSAEADLRVWAGDLGAVYLGGVRLSTLAAAGRVQERAAGAVERATALFAWHEAPFCSTEF